MIRLTLPFMAGQPLASASQGPLQGFLFTHPRCGIFISGGRFHLQIYISFTAGYFMAVYLPLELKPHTLSLATMSPVLSPPLGLQTHKRISSLQTGYTNYRQNTLGFLQGVFVCLCYSGNQIQKLVQAECFFISINISVCCIQKTSVQKPGSVHA